jgi:hypothetical protein
VCARFSAVSVDEAMKFIVQTNLIWMIRLKDIMIQVFFYLTNLQWYKFFILQTYLSHDLRFFLLQCERNMVLSFLKSIC